MYTFIETTTKKKKMTEKPMSDKKIVDIYLQNKKVYREMVPMFTQQAYRDNQVNQFVKPKQKVSKKVKRGE